MRLVGIDFATAPNRCGVCVLEDDEVTYVDRGRRAAEHPEWLLDHCSGADVVAVDVPFGWPKPFAEALCDYEIGVALDRNRRRLMYRATDTWIVDTLPQHLSRGVGPPRPFSVSADRIGAAAMVGTILLNALSEMFQLSPWGSHPGPAVIEVYPAVSLWAWGLPHQALEVPAVLHDLLEAFTLSVSEAHRRNLLENRDCLDAFISALTGGEYLADNTFDPPEQVPEDILRVEGWIRVPNRLALRGG